MQIAAWTVHEPGEPLSLVVRDEAPGPGEVIVQVAGCGVCHTDLGFYFDRVPTRHPYPLTLGHEISGTVVATGTGAEAWRGAAVIVPAVIPCGDCRACATGHGSICRQQIFPGNDVHGGFASHLRIPARGLCRVPDLADPTINPQRLDLASLAVIADAVTTPYQAIRRSKLGKGDLAIFVGCGGVGGFGVQLAAALGAVVIALDVRDERLAAMREHGASEALRADQIEFRELRRRVRARLEEHEIPTWRLRIFETSGTAAGQQTAFGLLEPGSYLSIVGFTPEKVQVRLSNLMALDARVEGNWGCLPELYPAVLDLVLRGRVALAPFVERRPLSSIDETFHELHEGRIARRVVLIPDRPTWN
jgi:6-hydroxycyclohex-1-ene-1-carbonyl-CoA dehydrogenase